VGRGDSLLTYSQTEARRLANIRRQPLVSLNFDSHGGDDIVVLTGTAEILDGYPAVPDNPAWLDKYGEAIDARFGSAAKFAQRFSVPVRIHLTRVRLRHQARGPLARGDRSCGPDSRRRLSASAVVLRCDSTCSPAADRSLGKRVISRKPRAA
jgi:PPOX class probable F420-dependent enzyme